jgi:hypothetical protein
MIESGWTSGIESELPLISSDELIKGNVAARQLL